MQSLIISAGFSDSRLGKSRHYHDRNQIIFITKGEIEITISGVLHTAKSGSLILISRLEEHSIKVKSDEYHRYFVEISPNILISKDESAQLLSVLVNRPESFQHVTDAAEFKEELLYCLCRIVEEKKRNDPLSEQMLDLLLSKFFIILYRSRPELFSGTSGENAEIVLQIQKEFEEHYQNNYTLQLLSEKYHLSIYYLSHLFKKVTGYSVMDHLKNCRIAAAKKMLTSTNDSIGHVTEHCGFTDASNFSRYFRQSTGLSPSQFRKKYKDKL